MRCDLPVYTMCSRDEAVDEAHKMLDVYKTLCERVLAMPVIPGAKSASERFAGAEETLTIEAMMQNGEHVADAVCAPYAGANQRV